MTEILKNFSESSETAGELFLLKYLVLFFPGSTFFKEISRTYQKIALSDAFESFFTETFGGYNDFATVSLIADWSSQ